MGFKIISDIWRPSLATHCWRRSRKFITLRVISGGMASISCRILSFKSSRDRGRCLITFSYRYPQRKKSHGLKSGDGAGHPTSPLKEIKRPGNIFLNTPSFHIFWSSNGPRSARWFFFSVDPVARRLEIHSKIVFRSGTDAFRPSAKRARNALCVAITEWLFS